MRLENFNGADYFQNKPHSSTTDEITHVKQKVAAFKKERNNNNDNITDLYNEYRDLYRKNNTIIDDFENSTEYDAYLQVKVKLQDRSLKLCTLIRNNEQLLMRLASKDMFDEQKNALTQSGYSIPNVYPVKIPTSSNSSTANPYYDPDATDKFVGYPWDYKWWVPKTIKQYTALSKYLKDQKKQGFTIVYACKKVDSTKFIMIGDHGKFIWRTTVSRYGNGTGITHSSIRNNGAAYGIKQFLRSLTPYKTII